MHISLQSTLAALLALASAVLASPQSSRTQSAAAPSFTYNNSTFLLNGEPYRIIGGQMDPQRIPQIYWRDRLAKARAMGLNTIFSYVYWNLLEPEQGLWLNSEEGNDIAEYFRIAQEEGLNVVLRPGPYICGEREWGGFPAWLSEVPGLVVRTYNKPFLDAGSRYIERLANDIRELQVTRGGPLLMVQVENEYGSYGENHNYTQALRDILLQNFEVPLYTNDGGVDWTLAGGEVPNVLAEIDGDVASGFKARALYITNPTEWGPYLDGEYYTLAPDFWGSANPHNTTVNNPYGDDWVPQFVKDLEFVLPNASISLYMFHGGTNFGFSNGALWRNATNVFTTSYDYGAPLDESGRTTALYYTLRATIEKYVPNGTIPEVPADLPRLSIPDFTLSSTVSLFDTLANKTSSPSPVTMEALGQAYGLILYEHQITSSVSGIVHPGDRARDRVLVYVNGTRQGVIDSTYLDPANVSVALRPGDKLQLLVENMGRTDYWSRASYTYDALLDPYKGIMGDVTVGNSTLTDWDIYSLPLEQPPSTKNTTYSKLPTVTSGNPPVFYHGQFWIEQSSNTSNPATLDTYLAVPSGIKGNVWVNGFNLGRYWIVGPQQSLYLPGTVLNAGAWNEVDVLELEPQNATMVARGEADRYWANFADPDAP